MLGKVASARVTRKHLHASSMKAPGHGHTVSRSPKPELDGVEVALAKLIQEFKPLTVQGPIPAPKHGKHKRVLDPASVPC